MEDLDEIAGALNAPEMDKMGETLNLF